VAADHEAQQVEIAAVIREIQDRVRERYPLQTPSNIHLPDLLPILHARDRAEAKIGAIGTVNPRPPGVINNAIQGVKNAIARSLRWFVRDQVEFNRASMECVQAMLEALNQNNRALQAIAAQSSSQFEQLRRDLAAEAAARAAFAPQLDALRTEAQQLQDVRLHWAQWRQDWERKLAVNEVQFLRSVADLQSSFQHQAALSESNFRHTVSAQHSDFTAALDRSRIEIQERLWADLDRARTEFEQLIHRELRVVRQRAASLQPAPVPATTHSDPQTPDIDFLRFADRFRGSEDWVRKTQQRHLAAFTGCTHVLDIGCGRGEFLQLLTEHNIPSPKGIDLSEECVAICRSKGLQAETADLFAYLAAAPPGSIDGIYCAQVVEHLPPARLPEMLRLAAEALPPGGKLLIETPNPACLAIFATHFYLDPTHQRPVPAPLLAFYLEERGFAKICVETLNPAVDTLEGLADLPAEFREAFFGGLDYAVTATRL
jgi:O-antigen chain-terminating methyltransferase